MGAAAQGFENVLAECLAALEQGEGLEMVLARYPGQAAELQPLLQAAALMKGAQPALAPRPGFVAASKGRLLAQIAAPSAVVAPVPRPGPLERLSLWWAGLFGGSRRFALQAVVILAVLACLVLGSSGIAYASQAALPGDSLYPLKVGLEDARLLVNTDPAEEARLHLQYSQRRLAEIEELVRLRRFADLGTAMQRYAYHVDSALRWLEALAQVDPLAAANLAADLKQVFAGQAAALLAQEEETAAAMEDIYEQAIDAAEQGASRAEDIEEEAPIPAQPTENAPAPVALTSPTALVPASPPTTTPENADLPVGRPSQTQTETPATSTPTATGTPTPRLSQTSTAAPTHDTNGRPTATLPPSNTPVPSPTASLTPRPTATATQPPPTSTNTPRPTSTNTPRPTATQPPPTNTQPPPTSTQPPPTDTPVPPTEPPPTPYPGPGGNPAPWSFLFFLYK